MTTEKAHQIFQRGILPFSVLKNQKPQAITKKATPLADVVSKTAPVINTALIK